MWAFQKVKNLHLLRHKVQRVLQEKGRRGADKAETIERESGEGGGDTLTTCTVASIQNRLVSLAGTSASHSWGCSG
jgi:hypothetical protein